MTSAISAYNKKKSYGQSSTWVTPPVHLLSLELQLIL